MDLIVAYIGNVAPRYVWSNLAYLNSTFMDCKVVFVTDNPHNLRLAAAKKIRAWRCADVATTWGGVRTSLNHPLEFRQGFWFSTMGRFKAIEEYLRANPGSSALHVEADVWLSPEFPIGRISEIERAFAFPLESENLGVASTLYIRDHDAAQYLVDYAVSQVETNPKTTDMFILGSLANDHPTQCLILPTVPRATFETSRSGGQFFDVVSREFPRFNGLFDGVHWGMYMMGCDPCNHRGRRHVFENIPGHIVNPSSYLFAEDSFGLPAVVIDGAKVPLYSLHIHSKDLRAFSLPAMQKLWRKRLRQQPYGMRREFVADVFLMLGTKYVLKQGRRFIGSI